ncbi:asparaginase [Hydrogeniiclostridium mannosilyticum]|uniref:asparaginase n=1 Tax=Hydrogeniiclostridium mannosilyticum TaxID=2764322 RepID=UPI0021150618|nr:asparaginase [Hydrogeniiclostridium mannosilyticum]
MKMHKKKILLIATGGTIASRQTAQGLAPGLSAAELLREIPEAAGFCEIETASPFLLDSTNITPAHWLDLAACIEQHYQEYDGFVVCHGTDTLAYTAAALSYLIQRSPKPVVITGAQRPISWEETDARMNLLDSLRCACGEFAAGPGGEGFGPVRASRASRASWGVCVVFGGRVIAGTRARKLRTKSYDAFSSIGFPDLARIQDGRVIPYIPPACVQGGSGRGPLFYRKLDPGVMVLKLTPGMPAAILEHAGRCCDTLVLQGYGSGGLPQLYREAFQALVRQGKTVVMATQAPQEGSDLARYEVGHRLKKEHGLLECYDLTLEATVAKLMWARARAETPEQLRALFYRPVALDMLLAPHIKNTAPLSGR